MNECIVRVRKNACFTCATIELASNSIVWIHNNLGNNTDMIHKFTMRENCSLSCRGHISLSFFQRNIAKITRPFGQERRKLDS